MLKITTTIAKDNRVEVPIYFDRKNECACCGGKGTLIFIDKFGKEARGEYHPFDHIECKKCGHQYSILWKKDKDSLKMYPSAVDKTVPENFTNMVYNNAASDKYID